MPIVLYRVDERLIHGQVIVGWGGPLQLDRLVVVDDELAESPWEQELYRLGLPEDIEASFVSVEEARRSVATWVREPARTALLLRDVQTLQRLAEGALLRGTEVNLGGIHHAPGRKAVLPYLYLSTEEKAALERISEDGVSLSAQDLPSSRRLSLSELLPRG